MAQAVSAFALRIQTSLSCRFGSDMSDEPDSTILRYLRRIDERLDRVDEGIRNLNAGVGSVEERVAGLRKDFVRLEVRVDQMDDCMKRMERRLDLTDVR